MQMQNQSDGLASPATDFYFVEVRGPGGIPMVVAVACSVCSEGFSDTRVGNRLMESFIDKAIEHSKATHQVPHIQFCLGKRKRSAPATAEAKARSDFYGN